MKRIILALLSVGLLAGTANADLITGTFFDADFTTGQGYSDGVVNGQPGFAETQAGYLVSDAAGTGILTNNTGAFIRAQFGGNGLESQTLAVGDMVLLESRNLNVTLDPSNQTIVFGLSGGGGGGAAQMALGGQITTDGTSLFVENGAFGIDTANRVDTGFDIGQTFDYGVKLTAETAGAFGAATFTIDHMVNGTSIYNETGQVAGTINAATSTTLAGFIQDQGGANFNTTQLTISTIAGVPEPGSIAILGIASLAVLTRRRR